MSNKQETIAYIVAEMRNEGRAGDSSCLEWVASKLRSYADRIEDAANREREATREKLSQAGNSAKIREALDKLLNFLRWVYAQDYPVSRDKLADAIDIGVSALAAPPRNCDVGTADEQEDRFERFCDAHKYVGDDGANICSQDCPCYNNLDCGVRWAQMPYEKGGAK